MLASPVGRWLMGDFLLRLEAHSIGYTVFNAFEFGRR